MRNINSKPGFYDENPGSQIRYVDGLVGSFSGNFSGSFNNSPISFTASFIHASGTVISNPFGNITPSNVIITSTGSALESYSWKVIGSNIIITASYDLKHTEPFIVRSHSTTQVLPHVITTVLVYDTAHDSRGSAISYINVNSTGTFHITEPGTYLVQTKTYFEQTTYTGTQVRVLAGGIVQTDEYRPVTMSPGPVMSPCAIVPAVSGTTIQVQAWQQNGTSATRNIMGNATATRATHVKITRLYNDTIPTSSLTISVFP